MDREFSDAQSRIDDERLPVNRVCGEPRGREQRALTALKRGDMDALHFFYVKYSSDVYGVVQRLVRNHHESEDIAQGVFAKLPRIINRYEEREVPFVAWVTRVARNAALDYLRARRQIPVDEVRVADSGRDQISLDRLRALREGLARLPEDQRQVLAMRHIAGMTPGEIAERMDKSEPSVHGLHHRGRAALRETLEELEASPTTCN